MIKRTRILLLLPVLIHLIAFSVCVIKYRSVDFRVFDLVFYLFFTGYLIVALCFSHDPKKLNKLLLLVYALMISVLLGDLLLRFMLPQRQFGTPWLPMHRVSQASDAMPGIKGRIELSVNKYGLRGPDVDLEEVDHKILCIGGSSTECLYVTDKKSWPWLLQTKLNEALPETVFVGNAGRSGHFTLQHEALLQNYRYVDRFDWVVFSTGINDMGRLMRKDYEAQLKSIAEQTLEHNYAYKSSPYYDRLMINVILSLGKVKTNSSQICQDPEGAWYNKIRTIRRKALEANTLTELPSDLDRMLDFYAENLGRIIKLCRKKGLKMLFLTQPTIYNANMSEKEKSLLWEHVDSTHAYREDVLEQMMARYNARLLEVCRQYDVPCLDLATMLPKNVTVLYDDCHLNTSGCERVAEILADYFRERLSASN